MQVHIINGIYADSSAPDFRTSYPRNMIPVPKENGISNGYLRPAEGIVMTGTGPGPERGGISWQAQVHRVMGTTLCRVAENGAVTALANVGDDGRQVAMDYAADRIAIASAGNLYYWNGATLTQVTDPDLGVARDVIHLGGYFITTDGDYIVVTELSDPTSVNPLKYGSAEIDSDPILSVARLRTELYAMGRHTIEVFQNVGGDNFPFQRIEGAQVMRGIIGRDAYCELDDTFYFLGNGRSESPGIYRMAPGSSQKISTREIDQEIARFSEGVLQYTIMEARVWKNHSHVLVHLTDKCLVYDASASQAIGEPVWFTLDSGLNEPATYRARNLVWAYNRWNVGDPTSQLLGSIDGSASTHFGQPVGWEFTTPIVYNAGDGAIVHELELVCLPGRVPLGVDPTVWTSYSNDGVTWSQERPVSAGLQGARDKRICWRRQGQLRHWRTQRFRGNSGAHLAVARLEVQIEPLSTRATRA